MTTHSYPGSRRWSCGAQLAVWSCALLLVAALVPGCGLDSPSSPNSPGDLQGNTPNQWSNFKGSVRIFVPSTTLPADDVTALPIRAEVVDDTGRPATNLTPVAFRTDLGTFGIDPVVAMSAATVNSFGGAASIDLRSFQRDYGNATVYASVGNVTAKVDLELEYVEVEGGLNLAFRAAGQGGEDGDGSQDLASVFGFASSTSPYRVGLVAAAFDPSGNALGGVKVRFRIVSDDTDKSGMKGASLDGEEVSFTSFDGEAYNQLKVVGNGTVVLEADLIDPLTDEVISTSNEIIAVLSSQIFLKLSFSDGSTLMQGSAPASREITARVTDANLRPVAGMLVRFTVSDPDTTSLTPSGDKFTGPEGMTKVTLNVSAGAATGAITITAKVLGSDEDEEPIATSNTITYTVQ